MTHVSFNWPPDRRDFGLQTGRSSGQSLSPATTQGSKIEAVRISEAIGLSIALKYFDGKPQGLGLSKLADIDATRPWRSAVEQVISADGKLVPDTPTS